MPIEGKLYSSADLQEILGVSKQRVANLANDNNWDGPQPGLYWAEWVEPYLLGRNIDPADLKVRTFDHPEGITWAEQGKLYDAATSL